jgi:hypothetical protein
MTINTDDVLRVDIIGDNDGGDDITNSYQLQMTSGVSVTDDQGIEDIIDWAEALLTILNDILNAVTKWRKIKVFNQTQSLLVGEEVLTAHNVGTLTNDPLPPGVSYLLSFPTKIPNVRLRKYFGIGDESLCTASGNVAASALTELLAVGAFLETEYTGSYGTWQYGHLSAKTSSFEVPASVVATNIFAYQRRRRPGTGE